MTLYRTISTTWDAWRMIAQREHRTRNERMQFKWAMFWALQTIRAARYPFREAKR